MRRITLTTVTLWVAVHVSYGVSVSGFTTEGEAWEYVRRQEPKEDDPSWTVHEVTIEENREVTE